MDGAFGSTSERPVARLRIAYLVGWTDGNRPAILFDGCEEPEPALTLVPLSENDFGALVVVGLLCGGDQEAVVIGLLSSNTAVTPADGRVRPPRPSRFYDTAAESAPIQHQQSQSHALVSNGEEIVLRCGKASVTLTRAGKIILRGTHISSRSSGVNRIKGGSVQIN